MFSTLRARSVRLVVSLVAVGALAASCGDDDDGSGAATSAGAPVAATNAATTTVAFDPAGIVKANFDLAQVGGVDFDPLTRGPGFYVLQEYVYDTPLHRTASGTFEPGLAQSASIVDPKTVEVKLRPNLVFSDGTPLDADAFKIGVMRNATSQSVGFRADIFEVQDVQVVDKTTARLVLKSESAGAVYAMLAYPEFFLVSPKAIADKVDLKTKPVGAGPFTLSSVEAQVAARFRKNPTYYGANDLKLGGIDVIHTANGTPAALNGLLSGQIDLATIELTQVDGAKAAPGVKTDISTGTSYGMIYWCKSKPPLDDVRVRQALSYATNRDEIVTIVQGGQGTPAWGLWPKGSKLYVPELDNAYKYDLNKAKELLTAAGYANGFTIEAFASPGAAQKTAELLQAQWGKVGVKINFVQTNDYVTDFMRNARAPMWVSGWSGAGNRRISRLYGPGQLPNVCNYNDPELIGLLTQLNRIDETSPEGIRLWDKMQRIVTEKVLSMNLAWSPVATAYQSDRLAGFEMMESAVAGLTFNHFKLYVKKK